MKKNHAFTRYAQTKIALLGFCALVSGAFGDAVQAQVPNKPITLIVPFAAGGNLDIVGRLIAPGLAKHLGHSVVVQNKPGAGGSLALQSSRELSPTGLSCW